MKLNQYHSFLCFDGEEGNAADAAAASAAAAATGNESGVERKFTQEDVNKFMAAEDRKNKEKLRKLETSLTAMSEDRSLNEQQRESLANELEDLRKSLRTKEQQAEHERKQQEDHYKVELQSATQRADHWENMFKQSAVDRALQDAAGSADTYNPRQIVDLLRPHTTLKEVDGSLTAMIDFQDVDAKTGEPITTLRTPADAVKRMQEMELHKNLFKSNIVSGVGAGSGASTSNEDIDYASLTPEQYRAKRKEIRDRLSNR